MLPNKKRTLVSFDWAAKYILRDKANFDVLEGFLSSLLKQDVKIISLLESEGTQEYETDKFNKVDLVVEAENKELIIVEIQNSREIHYFQRLLYGSSKLIVDHLELGESYAKVKKVISISVLYFLLGEGESDYVYYGNTEFFGFNDKSKLKLRHHNKEALVGSILGMSGNIFPEYYLIEVERFQDIINCDLDEWIYFFKNSEIKPEFKAKNIQLARQKLDILKMSEGERRAYEKYLMNKAYETEVMDTAIFDREIEIAKNMLAKGLEISLISETTGLPEAEIERLKH